MSRVRFPSLVSEPSEGAEMPLTTTPPDCQLCTAMLPIAVVDDSTVSRTLPSTMVCTAPPIVKVLTGSVVGALNADIGPARVTPSSVTRPSPPAPDMLNLLVESVPVMVSVGSAVPWTNCHWPGPVRVAVTVVPSSSTNVAAAVDPASTVPTGAPLSSSRGS